MAREGESGTTAQELLGIGQEARQFVCSGDSGEWLRTAAR